MNSHAIIACDVLQQEVETLLPDSPKIASLRFLEMGLHDHPIRLRGLLQEEIDRIESELPDVDVIILVYGVCGCGTTGLRAQRSRLILPRAHDCITLFLGSKERYRDFVKGNPHAYFYTPGWNRGQRVPGPEKFEKLRREYAAKFDPEEVEFLMDTEREQLKPYSCAAYTDMGIGDSEKESAYAQRCAKTLGWGYQRLPGDASLLRDLLHGPWDDERFLVVHPGQTAQLSHDDRVIRPI